jgi:hypothetical protein
MAGTNAVLYKRALIDRIAALLPGIQVAYSWPGATFDRECVHGGRVQGTQQYATFAGGRARLPRDETFVVDVFVAVRAPGADDGYDVEHRLGEIGQAIEDGIAAAPQIESVVGMLYAGVTDFELDSEPDDDAWGGVLRYGITVRSRLN